MNTTKLRTLGKLVYKQTHPRLTLVPPLADDPTLSVSKVELSPEVKEMLREMQEQRRARRGGLDEPEAA